MQFLKKKFNILSLMISFPETNALNSPPVLCTYSTWGSCKREDTNSVDIGCNLSNPSDTVMVIQYHPVLAKSLHLF